VRFYLHICIYIHMLTSSISWISLVTY
jgi:hypothetical protein